MAEVAGDPVLEVLLAFDREQAGAETRQSRQRTNADYLLDTWPALIEPIIEIANSEMERRHAALVLCKGQRSMPRRAGSKLSIALVDTHPHVAPNNRYHAPSLCLTLTEEETIEAKVELRAHCPHPFATRDLGAVTDYQEALFRQTLADYVAFALRDITRHRAH